MYGCIFSVFETKSQYLGTTDTDNHFKTRKGNIKL